MSLLVDLQLAPQRILEKVRAAVLQNREALRHGGIRSRVNQATKQRPQFTKVGATMRDYKAPVPVATGLETDQSLAWAYVLKRWNDINQLYVLSTERGINHSIYSADGSARYDNQNEEEYTNWTKGAAQQGLEPFSEFYVDPGTGETITVSVPYVYPSSTTITPGYNPDEEMWQLGTHYLYDLGFSRLPVGAPYNERKVLYSFYALPVGRDQVIIHYCAQKVVSTMSIAVIYVLFLGQNPFNVYEFPQTPTVYDRFSYHQSTTVSPVAHWSVLVGSDFVKEITPSGPLAAAIGATAFYQPGTYTYNRQELEDASRNNIYEFIQPPTIAEANPGQNGFLVAPLNWYASFGGELLNGNAYAISRTPGFYESFKQQQQVNADYADAIAEGTESNEYKQLFTYEYMNEFVPPWASQLRLVTTAHPDIASTTAKWGGRKPPYASDYFNQTQDQKILEGDNLEAWRPVIKALQPPRADDDDFPQAIKDDYASDAASDESYNNPIPPPISQSALTTYMVLDWGRPSYCRQQLIELLGFTEADLAPPTPTP